MHLGQMSIPRMNIITGLLPYVQGRKKFRNIKPKSALLSLIEVRSHSYVELTVVEDAVFGISSLDDATHPVTSMASWICGVS